MTTDSMHHFATSQSPSVPESRAHVAAFPHDALATAIRLVAAERARQHTKWGIQRHSWPEWLSILTEEVGEAAQAGNQAHWGDRPTGDLLIEMVQTAAVAMAIIEHLLEGGAS